MKSFLMVRNTDPITNEVFEKEFHLVYTLFKSFFEFLNEKKLPKN